MPRPVGLCSTVFLATLAVSCQCDRAELIQIRVAWILLESTYVDLAQSGCNADYIYGECGGQKHGVRSSEVRAVWVHW